MIPPTNYGNVEPGIMYRSGWPEKKSIAFVESLMVRSILTLTNTKNDACAEYLDLVERKAILRKVMELEPNKDGTANTSSDLLCEAVVFALQAQHHPVYIHCNQGRHRTGCVVAIIRKVQGLPMDKILEEYRTYSNPKPRDGDIALIKGFDISKVHAYAQKLGVSLVVPSRKDSFEVLAPNGYERKNSDASDTSSSGSDDLMMADRSRRGLTRTESYASGLDKV